MRAGEASAQFFLVPRGGELGGVGVEGQAPAYSLRPLFGVHAPHDVDGQAEAIEELRSKLAFFGVHRAHENEAAGV